MEAGISGLCQTMVARLELFTSRRKLINIATDIETA